MDKLKSLMIFSRSARQLGMAPSAVSRAVLRLETQLGVRLLGITVLKWEICTLRKIQMPITTIFR